MNDLISICIPAYNRPELLAIALESCAVQAYDPIEIVIGDDSTDDRSAAVAERFKSRRNWVVSYQHNVPSLGQNANVANLFERARGDRLALLHDDDVFLSNAIGELAQPWVSHPDLAVTFGKGQIISHDGVVDPRATDELNRDFYREGREGVLESPMRAALLMQMPNDGFMVRSDVARSVGYRSDAEVGVHADLDFTLRLGAALGPGAMYLLESYVSQYRLTEGSISRSPSNHRTEHPRAARALLETIESLPIPDSLRAEKTILLKRFIESMVKGYAISKERRTALRLFWSEEYGWRRRRSLRGLYHFLLILDQRFDRLRRYT